ncbi:hypothetical protein BKA67DRAFT_529243 [Truncatella angustata]|uniref:Uncharacterized protein n=1 Tax=Truncatella angustata TaxID=152316 RepID=A0A9P8UW11_9PEZI|nr:uncharacterized protein BKA67DRAFT_529243 [Truncatella angustata]KAH6659054.1 hypothetical protein BKA67DRAFT_529243 [Truncatella angustata]
MTSGIGPGGQTAYRTKSHILAFQDYTGSCAVSVWRGRATNPLPLLYSYAIYSEHPNITPENVDAEDIYAAVADDPLYGSNDAEYRLDLYFVPRGIEFVSMNAEPTGRLPRLVSSSVYDTVRHRYHNLTYIFKETDWSSGDQLIARVEFDPLSQAECKADSKDQDDPQEPDVLPGIYGTEHRGSLWMKMHTVRQQKRVDELLKAANVHPSRIELDIAQK